MSSHQFSNPTLIHLCRSCPESQFIGGSKYGNRVIKISDDLVVKFGPGVSSHEAMNQMKALELVDSSIVQVPRVHRFFTDNSGWGYILMDYIEGRMIDSVSEHHVEIIANILRHFRSITRNLPGSLSGGPSTGILWPDTNDLTITNVSQIEEWFNSRLFEGQGQVTFQPCDLVLCHLDIAPRNIIWKDDNNICLLDWASAGFYPRILEHISQCIKEEAFNTRVLHAMDPISKLEMEQKERICQAIYNNQKFLL